MYMHSGGCWCSTKQFQIAHWCYRSACVPRCNNDDTFVQSTCCNCSPVTGQGRPVPFTRVLSRQVVYKSTYTRLLTCQSHRRQTAPAAQQRSWSGCRACRPWRAGLPWSPCPAPHPLHPPRPSLGTAPGRSRSTLPPSQRALWRLAPSLCLSCPRTRSAHTRQILDRALTRILMGVGFRLTTIIVLCNHMFLGQAVLTSSLLLM